MGAKPRAQTPTPPSPGQRQCYGALASFTAWVLAVKAHLSAPFRTSPHLSAQMLVACSLLLVLLQGAAADVVLIKVRGAWRLRARELGASRVGVFRPCSRWMTCGGGGVAGRHGGEPRPRVRRGRAHAGWAYHPGCEGYPGEGEGVSRPDPSASLHAAKLGSPSSQRIGRTGPRGRTGHVRDT